MTTPHPSTISPDVTRFYLRKNAIRPLLTSVNQLQQRDDMSGKMARKIGRIRRVLSTVDEEIQKQRQDLVIAHSDKYPADHELAGKPKPVYQTDQNGEPVFKKDDDGNDTDEKVILHDQYHIVSIPDFQADLKEMLDEYAIVDAPCIKQEELFAFKNIRGSIVDSLLDLEEGGEATIEPAAMNKLELVKDDPDPVKEEVTKDEVGVIDNAEERTAP